MSRANKAVALLSGGLDSTLAIKLLLEQGIEVMAVNFVSPFCTCSPRKEGECHIASEVARDLGIDIRVVNKGTEYLDIVRNPRFGHGRGMNPCIDCRIFMLRKVAEMLPEVGASFVITGEVLGQRPMSQHLEALRRIEKESGLAGRILRPLSAQVLDATIPETTGLVDRGRLLSIRGRSRGVQLAEARARGIDLYSCPAGGCLLTDPVIARRLKDLFQYNGECSMVDAKLVTFGRHLRLHEKLKAIVGRNQGENKRLMRTAGHYPYMELTGRPGPLLLMRGELRPGDRDMLGRVLRFYARKIHDEEVPVRWSYGTRSTEFVVRGIATAEEMECLHI